MLPFGAKNCVPSTSSAFLHVLARVYSRIVCFSNRRCELIDELRWTYGSGALPADIRDKMSSAEADYYKAYSDTLATYIMASGIDVTSVRTLCCARYSLCMLFHPYVHLLFSTVVAQYSIKIGFLQDMKPPREDHVQVVALRDIGRLMTTTGSRDVKEREVHIMRKYDAEPLIRQGWLRHIADRV